MEQSLCHTCLVILLEDGELSNLLSIVYWTDLLGILPVS